MTGGPVTGSAPAGNIGADGARFRAFFGVLFFFFTLGMMALLTVSGSPLALRFAVFLPAWISLLCLLQARARVCVFLAARGAVATELGTRRIDDPQLRRQFELSAGRLHLQALMAAAGLTLFLVLFSLLLPWRFPPVR